MKEKDQAPRTEQEQKITSTRSHCKNEVDDDQNAHSTETHREKSKVADHGSRDNSLVDEGSLTSEQVINSAKSDRRRRHRHKSHETSHHDQHSRSRYRYNCHSQERRRDTCDSDSHHDDRDTDKYRDRRSSLDGKKPYYEPRQRRRHSPSVVRDRYRGKGRRRRSRSHTNSYDDSKSWHWLRCSDNDVRDRHRNHEPPKSKTAPGNASPNSVTPKKGIGVCNLPTGVDSTLLPQTTDTSTTTARTSVTATDSSFTVDIDNDLYIESVETEDADNDTPAPREQTSVHVDDINPQETEPVKLGTS